MPSRPNRLTPTLVALTAVIAALLAAGASEPAAVGAAHRDALPPQGLYEGCPPGAELGACVERLATIRRGGFRYVLDYSAWYGSPGDVLRYADAAAALGLKLIWPLNNPAWRGLGSLGATYPGLAAGLDPAGGAGATPASDATTAARAIELVASHPATWGFYVGDELPAAEAARVRALSAAVRRLAPTASLLYIARPGVKQLAPFARLADVAGADAYPVGSGDPPVGRAARSARAAASVAGARTAMVLQAFSWSQYRAGPAVYPSAGALRAMRNAAIHHARPTMILWYSFQDILRSDRPSHRWRALVNAASSPMRGRARDQRLTWPRR